LQPRLDDLPLGRVDHDRYAGDIRLAGNQVEKAHHSFLGLQHAFVHVDVDDLSAVFDLLKRHLKRGGVIVFLDQPFKARGAGHVGPLADVDEQRVGIDVKRLKARQTAGGGARWHLARRRIGHRLGDHADVLGRRAAAAADNIDQPALGEFGHNPGHFFRRLVVFAKLVGQPGVGVRGDEGIGFVGQFGQIRAQLFGAQRAV